MAINAIVSTNVAGLAKAFDFGVKMGVDPGLLRDAASASGIALPFAEAAHWLGQEPAGSHPAILGIGFSLFVLANIGVSVLLYGILVAAMGFTVHYAIGDRGKSRNHFKSYIKATWAIWNE